MLVGAGMTFLVQSSSVFTSAITPLIGNKHTLGCMNSHLFYLFNFELEIVADFYMGIGGGG